MAAERDIILVHSSDVHIDHDYTARMFSGDGNGTLRLVLEAARRTGADAVLLAGDTFDSHRLPTSLLDETAQAIHEAAVPVVMLPGNHDPAIDEAVFHHPAFRGLDHLHILGVTHEEAVRFEHLDLEIWGRPHRDYSDMDPLAVARARTSRWQVAMAHGHYTPEPDRSTKLRPSWLIGADEIEATGADYVALGHWNRWVQVGNGGVAAYYSGSPDYARSVNIVRLAHDGTISVEREDVELPETFRDFAD